MWVLKGTFLGIGIFLSAVTLYVVARIGYALYLITSVTKSGRHVDVGGGVYDVRMLSTNPWLWGVLLIALAIGLWIFKVKRPA